MSDVCYERGVINFPEYLYGNHRTSWRLCLSCGVHTTVTGFYNYCIFLIVKIRIGTVVTSDYAYFGIMLILRLLDYA